MSVQILTVDVTAGWNTFRLGNFGANSKVTEVYATWEAGGILERLAVGAVEAFSDTTPPDVCGYYATDVDVDAGLPGPGFGVTLPSPGGVVASGETTGSLGIKATAPITGLRIAVKGP